MQENAPFVTSKIILRLTDAEIIPWYNLLSSWYHHTCAHFTIYRSAMGVPNVIPYIKH